MTTKYYVTMTDTFMSNLLIGEQSINKLVLICDSMEEALIVEENAKNRSDTKNVSIRSTKPYYNKKRVLTQFKDKNEYAPWYQKGYFKKK